MNSLSEVNGASSEEQTCAVSSLTAASSTDPGGSQHEIMNKATATTGTRTSTPGRWRRAQAKRVREERTEKAAWEEEFEAKLFKMAGDSVRKKMQEANRQPRPTPPPGPAIKPEVNIKKHANPKKKAKLRIHGEDDSPPSRRATPTRTLGRTCRCRSGGLRQQHFRES